MRRAWMIVPFLCAGMALAQADQPLTVNEAIQRAVQTHPQIEAARARAQAARNAARSMRGRLLPGVHLSEGYQHYDGPFTVTFPTGDPGSGAPPLSFEARAQDTSTFVASASQPLLGLAHLSQDVAGLYNDADAADEQVRGLENAIAEAVATQFLHLFEARATREIASSSVKDLNEQLKVGESRLAAGVSTRADVLRLQVAVKNADQAEIQARVQEDVARTSLLTLIGLPPDTQMSFAEPTELETEGNVPVLAEALATVQQHSPELKAFRLEAQAARHRSQSRLFQLLPEIDAEAAYVNVQGQAFAQPESYYVGARASWNIWQWGAGYYAWRASTNQRVAAERDAENMRRQTQLDATSRLLMVQSSASAVDVAKSAIASAEEAYRVTEALLKAGSATTTDLLDAQNALVQSRMNLVRSRYAHALTRVSLKRALGG